VRRVLSVERFADKALSLVKAKGSLSTVGLTTLTEFSGRDSNYSISTRHWLARCMELGKVLSVKRWNGTLRVVRSYRVSQKRNSRLRLDVLRPLQSQPEPRWTFASGKVANRNRREIFERRGRGAFSFRLLEKGRRRARRPSAAVEPTKLAREGRSRLRPESAAIRRLGFPPADCCFDGEPLLAAITFCFGIWSGLIKSPPAGSPKYQ
jgi:hypothetical protein